jgi:uncharacterized CHY-type Zn-finger protein
MDYLAIILEGFDPVERPPLEEAPLPERDLGVAQVCPHCGSLDSLITETEDGEIAQCPACQSIFTPKIEGLARQVIQKLSERRARRMTELSRFES